MNNVFLCSSRLPSATAAHGVHHHNHRRPVVWGGSNPLVLFSSQCQQNELLRYSWVWREADVRGPLPHPQRRDTGGPKAQLVSMRTPTVQGRSIFADNFTPAVCLNSQNMQSMHVSDRKTDIFILSISQSIDYWLEINKLGEFWGKGFISAVEVFSFKHWYGPVRQFRGVFPLQVGPPRHMPAADQLRSLNHSSAITVKAKPSTTTTEVIQPFLFFPLGLFVLRMYKAFNVEDYGRRRGIRWRWFGSFYCRNDCLPINGFQQ